MAAYRNSGCAVGLSGVTLKNVGKRSAGVRDCEDANQLVILCDDGRANMVLRHRTRDFATGVDAGTTHGLSTSAS